MCMQTCMSVFIFLLLAKNQMWHVEKIFLLLHLTVMCLVTHCFCVRVALKWDIMRENVCVYVCECREREIGGIYMDLSTPSENKTTTFSYRNLSLSFFLPLFPFRLALTFFIGISRPSSGNRPSLSSTVRDQKLLALYHYDHSQINVFGSIQVELCINKICDIRVCVEYDWLSRTPKVLMLSLIALGRCF